MHSCEQKTLADIQLPVYSIHFTFSTTPWKPSSRNPSSSFYPNSLVSLWKVKAAVFQNKLEGKPGIYWVKSSSSNAGKPLGWASFTFTTTFSFTISYSIIAWWFFSRVLLGKNPEKVPILGKAHLRMPPKWETTNFFFWEFGAQGNHPI